MTLEQNTETLLYTIEEVATLLRVNKNYVYSLIHKGFLKPIKLGRTKITHRALSCFLQTYDGYDFTNLDNVVKYQN